MNQMTSSPRLNFHLPILIIIRRLSLQTIFHVESMCYFTCFNFDG